MASPEDKLADPFMASRLISAARGFKPGLVFTAAPVILLAVIIPAAIDQDITQPGHFSRISDLRHLLRLSSTYVSTPVIALDRDGLTVALTLLVGYTFACTYAQCHALADCLPELAKSGVLRWRTEPQLDQIPWMLRRSFKKLAGDDADAQIIFARWLDNRMRRIRHSEPFMLAIALIAAAAFQYAIYRTRFLRILAPYSFHPAQRTRWANSAYKSWWASYYHWPGALAFLLIAAFAVFVILEQNAVVATAVTTAGGLRAFAEPGIDWLNVDGHYGWLPVEKVFKMSYLSIALRGVSISVLIIGFGSINTVLVVCVAAVWLTLVALYHLVPYASLFAYTSKARRERIEELARASADCRAKGRKKLEVFRFYADEIERVHRANINPMHLPKWQFSTIALAVVLPVALTVIQIAF
jgi:hypothetical protein